MAAYTALASNESLINNDEKSDEIVNINMNPPPFYEMIPYKTTQSKKHESFWDDNINKKQKEKEDVYSSVFIGLLSIFSTISQIIFIIYGAAPYKWYSFTMLIISQFFVIATYLYIKWEELKWTKWYIIMYKCLTVPCILPVIFPIMSGMEKVSIYRYSNDASLIISALQSFPQLILLHIMMAFENNFESYNNTYFICSYIASILSTIAMSVQLASIHDVNNLFILNIMFLFYDFSSMIFISSAIFYDNNAFIIFCIDIGINSMWMIIPSILFILPFNLLFNHVFAALYNIINNNDSLLIIIFCCFLFFFIISPAIIIIWILFMMIVVIPIMIIPTLYHITFMLFELGIMDQINEWNILPPVIECMSDTSKWRLYEWIQSATSLDERNDRFCYLNMVILENEQDLFNKYQDIYNSVCRNIHESIRFGTLSSHQLSGIITSDLSWNFTFKPLNQLLYKNNTTFDALDFLFLNKMIWLALKRYYVITRSFHFIMVPIVALYVISTNKQNLINSVIISAYLSVILLLICIFYLFIVRRSFYNYHRFMLPVKHLKINIIQQYAANCHHFIGTIKTVINYMEQNGGGRCVANIILDICYGHRKFNHMHHKYYDNKIWYIHNIVAADNSSSY